MSLHSSGGAVFVLCCLTSWQKLKRGFTF